MAGDGDSSPLPSSSSSSSSNNTTTTTTTTVTPSSKTDLNALFHRDLTLPDGTVTDVMTHFISRITTLFTDYMRETSSREDAKVVNYIAPKDLLAAFDMRITDEPESLGKIVEYCETTLQHGVRTSHPRFYNQLFARIDPVAMVGEWLTTMVNTSMYTYEVAPVFILMEAYMLERMREFIGWDVNVPGDGLFSPGGSISNMYAMQAARHYHFPQTKEHGLLAIGKIPVVFTSSHSHYSIKKGAALMGLGMRHVIAVDVDRRGKMIPADLDAKIQLAKDDGLAPFFVNATAGTTVVGAFDPFEEIAAVCKKHGVWMHVDAAWGGSALVSSKQRELLRGVELADSVTWNPHKMMGIPLQCSAILIRTSGLLSGCNATNAQYLFQKDKINTEYDTGDKAIQCGRKVDVFKLWLAWKAKGDKGYERQIDYAFANSRRLAELIRARPGFELVYEPECTNVCFWYVPPSLRHLDHTERREALHRVAPVIKAGMQYRGSMMIGYQPLDDFPNFFRMVFSNPAVTEEDIQFILDEIENLGHAL
ncbi:glutamic acid decarboxylase isoform 67 [Capsaspora owczarzaki ATCC 30864]|uniref:Glutamic acid decarboxylase isoform 67 n=1 Tax=Capsaspora owczarzaki (strain ATCC 30864) TaxID=595528 RepID=A0A0D2WSQ9_CAPO3|nr:glutamic acid decarboxylase isoform 67 [Capsaspora owczarzaki ATCC 30864]KJE94528.1 glutamic acid decarboxylase isoform 67 [Capsaspora owczarzaki ATCC 30864]|eukprot:XP_004346846.1 glutamic acid decarboxylase isoform 67 [Capsaspora owczarzaki ATCC 30864]